MLTNNELGRRRGEQARRRRVKHLVAIGALLVGASTAAAALLLTAPSSLRPDSTAAKARQRTTNVRPTSPPPTVQKPTDTSPPVTQPPPHVQTTAGTTTTSPPSSGSAAAPSSTAMRRALQSAVARANDLAGRTETAVWIEGWNQPVEAGATEPMRMWSMSKPVAAVALLRLAHGETEPSPTVRDAMEHAIERSENCAQRRVVLELQKQAGGAEKAREAVQAVLHDAGATAQVATTAAAPEPLCRDYLLRTGSDLQDPLGPALPLGTSLWTVDDAVRFIYTLGHGDYGDAGSSLLTLMRNPKLPSGEVPATDYTAAADWGAGRALAPFHPAYKAGWGGVQHGNFLAGQIAVFDFHGRTVAAAAMFHPSTQPDRDDPGRTAAPTAIETIFAAVADELRAAPQGDVPEPGVAPPAKRSDATTRHM